MGDRSEQNLASGWHRKCIGIKGMAVYGKEIGIDYVAFATGYGALYIVAMVLLALVLFRRKDLQ